MRILRERNENYEGSKGLFIAEQTCRESRFELTK